MTPKGQTASIVNTIPHDIIATLEGSTWFPKTLADAFMPSLRRSFIIGAVLSGIAAVLSAMRGEHYVHDIHAASGVKVAATIKTEEKK